MFFSKNLLFLGIRIFRFIKFVVVGMGKCYVFSGLLGMMVNVVFFVLIYCFLDLCVVFIGDFELY